MKDQIGQMKNSHSSPASVIIKKKRTYQQRAVEIGRFAQVQALDKNLKNTVHAAEDPDILH